MRSQPGFSLIELLVVITIIGILGTIGLTMMNSAQKDSEVAACKATLQSLVASLDAYKNDRRNGAYPATSLDGNPLLGKMPNRTNIGIESVVAALESKNYRGDKPSEMLGEDVIVNVDGDFSQKPLTVFAAKDLFEYADPWGNPFAYFAAADYADPNVAQYLVAEGGMGDHELATVKPWTSPKTKSFYNPSSFQLFSAGQDGKFNTEDDIGNW